MTSRLSVPAMTPKVQALRSTVRTRPPGQVRAANLRVRVGDPIAADLSRRTSGTTAALPASS